MGRLGGLIPLGIGLGLIYLGFNDEFSIGEMVESTLKRNGRTIGKTVIREYDYFDAFKNRVPFMLFGSVLAYLGFAKLFEKNND